MATYGRTERGEVREVGLVRATLISAVLGADLSIKIFPGGPPLRDQAHGALLIRFQRRISPVWRATRESPMPIAGDQRAWDLRLEAPSALASRLKRDRPICRRWNGQFISSSEIAV
jgi:hypothetical protein